MIKHLVVFLTVCGLIFFNSGCTSQQAETETAAIETADAEKIEDIQAIDPSLDAALNDTGTEAPLDLGTMPEAPVDATAAVAPELDATSPPPAEVPPPALDANIAPSATVTDSSVLTTETTTMTTQEGSQPPVVESTTTTTLTETPITEPSTPATTYVSSGGGDEITETPITDPAAVQSALSEDTISEELAAKKKAAAAAAPKASAPLKKISEFVPYQAKDGSWINTVYIARPKEKLSEISEKIYGTDKSADLKKISENSYLRSRSVRAGDKIYYSSPNRPDDSSRTISYYEDMGLMPETYVAKQGENLRTVAKELLGYDNAWRELWSVNSVESKTSLKDGETLRYWKDSAPPAAATLMDSTQAPPATAATAPPAPTEASLPPPAEALPPPTEALPPPPADANASLPPPPAPDAAPVDPMAAAPATTEELPPQPELAADTPPPPPPEEVVAEADAAPRKKINLDEEAAAEEEGVNSDTLMSIGALGILLALLAFVIIRKKKQKAAAAAAAAEQQQEI